MCALVFMVLREDVDAFTPNSKDKLFCECISKAIESGVNVYVYQCKVNMDGIHFMGKLKYLTEV